MPEPIVYIDHSEVLAGKLDDLKPALKELVEFIHANEPQLLAYDFFLDPDESRMTLVAIHPDSASLEFHMEVGAEAFRKFRDFINLKTIDVYGAPSESAVDRLRQKAQMLGGGTVTVHTLQAGFARFGAR